MLENEIGARADEKPQSGISRSPLLMKQALTNAVSPEDELLKGRQGGSIRV